MKDLKDAIKKGTKAWADVPNASQWVEELRGNDKPPVKTYAGGKPNYCTPEVPCKTHPDAPHGFNRNASFDEDRYVCDCEFWEPDVDTVNMSEKRVHKSDKSIHEPVAWSDVALRDYFAASFVSSGHIFKIISAGNRPELVAEQAYMLADAMLKARTEKTHD